MEGLKLKYPELQEFGLLVNGRDLTMDDFPQVKLVFQKLHERVTVDEIPFLTKAIHHMIGQDVMNNTVQGFAYRKPHGYPGDFEVIDKTYRLEEHDNPHYGIWDKYYHSNAAAIAVRNRKTYFKRLIRNKIEAKNNLRVLNLASGPGRDMFEFFEDMGNQNITFDCVEMDPKAIDFSRHLNKSYLDKIRFINKNVFRFLPGQKYDLIWSAGLFDYFADNVFVRFIKRMKDWIHDDGEIIIGNFSKNNPTQGYMLIMVDWVLRLRSEDELAQFGQKAGFNYSNIMIDQEETGVNLFLRLKP